MLYNVCYLTKVCMLPKTKFYREAIVEAAFAIAKEESFAGITAQHSETSSLFGCVDLRA